MSGMLALAALLPGPAPGRAAPAENSGRATAAPSAGASALAARGGAAAALAAPGEWAQDGYGPQRTFYNPAESAINAQTIGRVRRQWSVNLPEAAADETCSRPSAPVVAAGRLFLTDETGIGAYGVAGGPRLWHHNFTEPDDTATPRLAVAGGLLIAATTDCHSNSDPDGSVMALDVATGRVRWTRNMDPPVTTMVVDRGLVVVSGSSPSDTPVVIAYRATDGRQRWRRAGVESDHLVAAAGRVLARTPDRTRILALSIATGRTLWTRRSAFTARAATPAGDRFFYRDDNGTLLCLRATDGAVLWRATVTGEWNTTDGRRVYFILPNSVVALDVRNGRRVWTTNFEFDPDGRPIRAGGLLYVFFERGQRIRVLNAETGRVVAVGHQFEMPLSWEVASLVVSGGRVFIVDYYGEEPPSTLTAYAVPR